MLLGGVCLEACEVVEEAQCLGVESSWGGGDNRHEPSFLTFELTFDEKWKCEAVESSVSVILTRQAPPLSREHLSSGPRTVGVSVPYTASFKMDQSAVNKQIKQVASASTFPTF
jgi:hypothetical protein